MLEAEGVSFAVLGTVCYTQETGLHDATTEHGTAGYQVKAGWLSSFAALLCCADALFFVEGGFFWDCVIAKYDRPSVVRGRPATWNVDFSWSGVS